MPRTPFALAAMLAASLARADGLSFAGDEPLFPHAWVQLETDQLPHLELDRGGPVAVLTLTSSQRSALRQQVGGDVPWVFVVDRSAAAGGCTCGAYNLSVREGSRLAVYTHTLGDFLSPADVVRIEGSLSDPALVSPPPGTPGIEPGDPASGALPALVERARALLAEARFSPALTAGDGWEVVAVKHAPVPVVIDDLTQVALGLALESSVSVRPTGAEAARWPDAGARRLEPDGTTIYAIPRVLEGEVGAPLRAWLLLAYQDGLLVEHAVVGEENLLASATYEWGDEPDHGAP